MPTPIRDIVARFLLCLDQDTLSRSSTAGSTTISNAAGWGTASSGSTWSSTSSAYTYSISGNQGIMNGASSNAVLFLGSHTTADGEVLVRVGATSASAPGMEAVLRATSTNNYYRAGLTSSGSGISISKVVSGTLTDLVTTSIPGGGYNPSTLYWLRFRLIGSNLALKCWVSGTSEPSSWTLTTSDTSIAAGAVGQVGLRAKANTSTEILSFDHVSVADAHGTLVTKDIGTRFILYGMATKDSRTRFRLSSGAILHDLALRFRLAVQTTRNLALRFRLAAIRSRDLASRFILSTGSMVRDLAARFRLASLTSYVETILADVPIAYYPLDETSGTTAHDLSSTHYDGTLHGGVALNQQGALVGDSDGAMLFDGSSGYIQCPSGLKTDGWSSLSVECWVNLTSNTFPNSSAFLVGNDSTPAGHKVGFSLLLMAAGNGLTGIFEVANGTASGNVLFGSNALPTGVWYHLVGTYDGTTVRVYVNAVQDPATAALTGTIGRATNPIFLANDPTSTYLLPGTEDEVALYPYSLSPSQVLAHYQAGRALQKDIRTRLRLASAATLHDLAQRFPLAATRLRDLPSRFPLFAPGSTRDFGLRLRLVDPPTLPSRSGGGGYAIAGVILDSQPYIAGTPVATSGILPVGTSFTLLFSAPSVTTQGLLLQGASPSGVPMTFALADGHLVTGQVQIVTQGIVPPSLAITTPLPRFLSGTLLLVSQGAPSLLPNPLVVIPGSIVQATVTLVTPLQLSSWVVTTQFL